MNMGKQNSQYSIVKYRICNELRPDAEFFSLVLENCNLMKDKREGNLSKQVSLIYHFELRIELWNIQSGKI